MADTDWFLEGKQLIYCSCDYGCPCEANAPPTYGYQCLMPGFVPGG